MYACPLSFHLHRQALSARHRRGYSLPTKSCLMQALFLRVPALTVQHLLWGSAISHSFYNGRPCKGGRDGYLAKITETFAKPSMRKECPVTRKLYECPLDAYTPRLSFLGMLASSRGAGKGLTVILQRLDEPHLRFLRATDMVLESGEYLRFSCVNEYASAL